MFKRTVVYLRVSGDGQTVEQQERAIRHALPHGVSPVVMSEKVSAWSGEGREQMDAMLDAVKKNKVKAIWTWSIDRFGRDWWEIVQNCRTCLNNEVELHFLDDALSSGTDEFELKLGLLAWLAAKESKRRSARVREKIAYLEDEFGYNMHGSPPKGYLSKKTLAKLPAIKAMLKDKMKIVAIAKVTGVQRSIIAKIKREPDKEWTDKAGQSRANPGWYKRPEDYGAPVHPRRRNRA